MNRNLVFLSSIIMLICSCNEKQPKFKEINIREVTTTENLKFNPVRLLRLKSNSFAPISGIDKLIVTKERVVVLDKLRGNSVFIYDFGGNYIEHIYRMGEGPGEYRNVENVFWDSFKNQLVLIPMDFKKKLYFDRDGNFIREEFYDEQIIYSDLIFLENGELIINNSLINLEPNLAIYHNDKLVMSEIPFDAKMDDSPLNRRSIISRIDNKNYLLSLGLRDTLYNVDIDRYQVEPAYMMNFQNEISFSKFSKLQNPLQYFMENDFYVGAIDLFQNTDFLSFSTLHFTGLQGRIYSKNTGNIYSTKELIEKSVGQLNFQGVLGITPKNEFVAVLSSGESGKWDFSVNPFLEKQFADFGEIDKEELILLIFDLEEDN